MIYLKKFNEINNTLSYRLAVNSDYKGIKYIANQWRSELGFVMRVAIEDSIKKSEVFVCEIGGNIVGFIHYHKRKDGWNTIHEIGVDKNFISKGIGKKLFNMVPIPRQLKTTTDNIKANEFYKRQGLDLIRVEKGNKRELNVWKEKRVN